MVFFVLEAHRALHFSSRIDKFAQRIAWQGVIIAAGVHILKPASFVEFLFRIGARENESFNFVSCIERVAFFLKLLVGKSFQDAANVRRVRSALLLDDIAKNQNLARPKEVRRSPVERTPVNPQPQIALAPRSTAADRRSVKGKVVPALQQELLVVVEPVQTTFQIAEKHSHSLDSLLIG